MANTDFVPLTVEDQERVYKENKITIVRKNEDQLWEEHWDSNPQWHVFYKTFWTN